MVHPFRCEITQGLKSIGDGVPSTGTAIQIQYGLLRTSCSTDPTLNTKIWIDGTGLTTVEIKVNYLAAVQRGRLIVKRRCIKMGETLALGDVSINNPALKETSWPTDLTP